MASDKEQIAVEKKEEEPTKDTNGEKNGIIDGDNDKDKPVQETTTDNAISTAAPASVHKVSLGEITAIDGHIASSKTDQLQLLHNLFYSKNGFGPQIKRNIRKFAGFEESEQQTKLDQLLASDIAVLRQTATILDLKDVKKDDTKESVAKAIIDFLMAPTGKTFAEEQNDAEPEADEPEDEEMSEEEEKPKPKKRGGQSTTPGGRPKRATAPTRVWADDFGSEEEEEEAVEEERPKVGRKKKGGDSDSGSDYNPSKDGSDSEGERRKSARNAVPAARNTRRGGRGRRRDSESEEEVSESEDFSEEEVAPVKKKATPNRSRRAAPQRGRKRKQQSESEESESEPEESEQESDDSEKQKKRKSVSKTTPQKNSKGRSKRAAAPVKKKRKDSSEDEPEEDAGESEDEPLKKPKKSAGAAPQPTDDEIKSLLKDILAEANLEEITMKTVCKKVYAHYPNHDLSQRKDFIKQTVKSLIAA